jgi:hypothetical protein
MDRLTTMLAAMLAGAAVLAAGPVDAQGHDPGAAAARERAQQAQASPESTARLLAEKLTWLQRLVGRYHARTVQTSGAPYASWPSAYVPDATTPAWTASYSLSVTDTRSPPFPATSSASPDREGRAECVATGIGVDVSCLVDVRAPQGAANLMSFRVSLPQPQLDEIGRMLEMEGSLLMGSGEGTPLKWVALKGNTATFIAVCEKRVSGDVRVMQTACGTRVTITARPDGTRVRVLIEPPPGSRGSSRYLSGGTTTVVLNRPRQYTDR